MSLYLNQEDFENIFKNHITTKVYSLSLKTLFSKRRVEKIKYDPYYQRNYVWDNSKATFFIESILLGTDVPPLIFFNTGSTIEVIDGRQRYETIKKFRNGELKLSIKGLTKLTQLQNMQFSTLDAEIQGLLDDAKIRIFEFEIFNEPRLDATLEDKIKKEIFRRYNSGITPLNSAEIDNATYDDDSITNELKARIIDNPEFISLVEKNFLGKVFKNDDTSKVLQFMRRYLVLSSFPISTYASGSNRTEIMDLLYGVKSQNTENPDEICESLFYNLDKTLELIKHLKIPANKLVNEALLWAIFILIEEEVDISPLFSPEGIIHINNYLTNHQDDFLSENSHHYKSIIKRHKSISEMISTLLNFDFSLFIKNDDFKHSVKEMRQSEKEAKLKLDELASLRVQKPEPSLIPIEEIVEELNGNKYLIRPSYQRLEKINVFKASAIIESILLGINLPPLFIYKNRNGVKEVIDGQQRLLSVLGFLGKSYQDENGITTYPKCCNFKLSRLKILHELNGSRFEDLDFNLQDKIYDFMLSVIEIDSYLNNNFDPVDLFIRLNNKPYPIKENSFEMWNSFMDRDVIRYIKEITNDNIEWFYIKQRNGNNSSDRMLNEELITLLGYNLYNSKYRPDYTSLGFYLRDSKVNCRITEKKDVSALLEKILTDIELKNRFLESIGDIEKIISILKSKLSPGNLKNSLNEVFYKEGGKRYLVDFYLLFQIMQRLEHSRQVSITFKELQDKMALVKSKLKNPEPDVQQQEYFENLLNEISV
ncbi:DUF262 domain-containing protein [Pseudoalteromonas sp. T1lg23B]|uniref:DUF262 domain-containing protein n=1 Tax=Pseudoalteromonas sp. T1lg23B TaxID=2077097 RepID=UPI000CF74E5D|nr:DUF262 domain-containing protein [Pseudoalteromonas sp. T1lg23B]